MEPGEDLHSPVICMQVPVVSLRDGSCQPAIMGMELRSCLNFPISDQERVAVRMSKAMMRVQY